MGGCAICSKILCKVGDGITLDLHACGGVGEPGCRSGVDPGGMIHEVGGKGRVTVLLIFHIPCQLMDNGTDHLKMAKFFCPSATVCHLMNSKGS